MSALLLLVSLGLGIAHAAPTTMTHQGRVTDAAGQPLNGELMLQFELHTHRTNDSVQWMEQDPVIVQDGYYATTLGDSTPLTPLDFAVQTYWMEVSVVGGAAMTPRTELSAVPAAMSLSGGFRPPSMTTVERNALNPQPGQMVFNTDVADVQVWDGTDWSQIGTAVPSSREPDVLVWGRNATGELGLDDSSNRPAPMSSPSMPDNVVYIDGGVYRQSSNGSLVVITADGSLYGSGYGNHFPVAGRGSRDTFQPFTTAMQFSKVFIANGGLHNCGITSDGTGYCWGRRSYGGIGDGTGSSNSYYDLPQPIVGTLKWKMLAPAGYYDGVNHDAHTCGVTTATGEPNGYCWGLDTNGVLGNGSLGSNYNGPTAVALIAAPADGWPNGIEWSMIDAGYYQTCGVDINGGGWCWGDAATGRLGTGNTSDRQSPTPVLGNHTWQNIQIGEDHACGLRTDGAVLCFGDNAEGQLGTGTTTDELAPVEIFGNRNFKQLSVGRYGSCAIDVTDRLYCWGDNGNGTMGNGDTSDRRLPTLVYGEYRFRDVHVAGRSVIARTR